MTRLALSSRRFIAALCLIIASPLAEDLSASAAPPPSSRDLCLAPPASRAARWRTRALDQEALGSGHALVHVQSTQPALARLALLAALRRRASVDDTLRVLLLAPRAELDSATALSQQPLIELARRHDRHLVVMTLERDARPRAASSRQALEHASSVTDLFDRLCALLEKDERLMLEGVESFDDGARLRARWIARDPRGGPTQPRGEVMVWLDQSPWRPGPLSLILSASLLLLALALALRRRSRQRALGLEQARAWLGEEAAETHRCAQCGRPDRECSAPHDPHIASVQHALWRALESTRELLKALLPEARRHARWPTLSRLPWAQRAPPPAPGARQRLSERGAALAQALRSLHAQDHALLKLVLDLQGHLEAFGPDQRARLERRADLITQWSSAFELHLRLDLIALELELRQRRVDPRCKEKS